MSGITAEVAGVAAEQAQPEAEQPTAGETAGTQPAQRMFTQAELDAKVHERLEIEKRRGLEAAERVRKDAERIAAEQQGEYEKLYQATLTDLENERSTRRALEAAAMRREVAAKVNLPAALVDRLQGETADELEADAKALIAALPKPAAPNINAGSPAGVPPANVMSEEERKLRAAALGVDWRYFNP